MRNAIAALTAVLAAGAVLPAPAAAGPRCPGGGKTIASTSEARVWSTRGPNGTTRTFGCARAVGRVVRLDPRGGQVTPRFPRPQLSGTMVAYEASTFDPAPFRVRVRNLRTGRVIHSAPSNAQGSDLGHTGPAIELVLKRNGSIAWTTSADCVCEGGTGEPPSYEVHAIGRDGRRTMLDSGGGIDPSSLRLSADRRSISWRHGSETRTAPLR